MRSTGARRTAAIRGSPRAELRDSYNNVKDELFAGIKALVQAFRPSPLTRTDGGRVEFVLRLREGR